MALQFEQQAWLAQFTPRVKAICPQYGVPWIACVGQAVLESGWGKYAPHFNPFGLHGKGDKGSTQAVMSEWTGDAKEGGYTTRVADVAKFSGWDPAIRRWCEAVTSGVFAGSTEYAADPVLFLTYLWASGYATEPDYVPRVVGAMQSAAKALGGPVPQSPSFLGGLVSALKSVPFGKERRALRDKLMPAVKPGGFGTVLLAAVGGAAIGGPLGAAVAAGLALATRPR